MDKSLAYGVGVDLSRDSQDRSASKGQSRNAPGRRAAFCTFASAEQVISCSGLVVSYGQAIGQEIGDGDVMGIIRPGFVVHRDGVSHETPCRRTGVVHLDGEVEVRSRP